MDEREKETWAQRGRRPALSGACERLAVCMGTGNQEAVVSVSWREGSEQEGWARDGQDAALLPCSGPLGPRPRRQRQ